MNRILLCALGLAVVSLVACGGPKDAAIEEVAQGKRPLAVIVDTIIEGEVLGQPLRAPYGVAVDFRGNVFVTDAGNHRLISFTDSLVPRREVGGFGGEPGLFNRPGFVTVDNGLTLLIADRGNIRLVRYNATLTFVNEIDLINTDVPGQFGQPSGVALSSYGEIWMADVEKDRIAVFNSADQFDRYVAEYGYSGGQVTVPEEIVELRNLGFLICDAGNGRVSLYDPYGNFTRSIGDRILSHPVAAAEDADGRLWVLDQEPTGLYCFDSKGALLFESPAQLTGSGKALSQASDIAVLKDGRLLIVDTGSNRLVIVRPVFNDG